MISVLTNITSLFAQRNLNQSSKNLSNNLSKLSSGLRVRNAADDAAGLAISESFKAKIRSLNQARRNANDGISLSQTADGALKEIGSMLARMRELSIQSANGTYNSSQRGHLNTEFGALKNEISRIASTTEFNGVALFSGTTITFQIGAEGTTNNRLALSIAETNTAQLSIDASSISNPTNALSAISKLDVAIDAISDRRATIGATQNRLQVSISNLQTYATNLTASNSRIVDVDIAAETAHMAKNQILTQAGAAMLSQANQGPQIALSLLR